MQNAETNIHYSIFDSIADLPSNYGHLVNEALKVAANAYAPYSKFKVGAAIELETGIIVTGNNQENIAYPSGLCAERVALFAASANNPQIAIKNIAIAALDEKGNMTPVSPCGACRQVISEYEKLAQKPIRIFFFSAEKKVIMVEGMGSLLPFGFEFNPVDRK